MLPGKRPSRSRSAVPVVALGANVAPAKSEAQRRAMKYAAEGKSTIGISPKVGSEFAKTDTGDKLPARSLKRRKRK
jgi:hypothetical protein